MNKTDLLNATRRSPFAFNNVTVMKVLFAVGEDYPYLPIKMALLQFGYEVIVATNSKDALRIINDDKPEFIILDIMISGTGAISICKSVRADQELAESRIIILSNSNEISERILALDAGSDEFLVNPFEIEVLLAKISSLQRRSPTSRLTHVLKAGTIEMLTEQWVVYVDGAAVNLTEKEYRLLQELLEVKGRVLTRENLLERVWGHQKHINLETRTVDVHMSRLRNKLGSSGKNIITVRNVGYRINVSLEWLRQ